MNVPGVRRFAFCMVTCLYLAAVCYVVFLIVDLQRDRFGSLSVSKVSIEGGTASSLRLKKGGVGV